jgi:hypothetical protein
MGFEVRPHSVNIPSGSTYNIDGIPMSGADVPYVGPSAPPTADGKLWWDTDEPASVSGMTYTETNVTTDRIFDADATSTSELADVLGTLIADLRNLGIIG